ncbi:MAG: hypothetical protein MMC23_007331 [Stictis urceolatum]|nr:hypothetical protein [Stictis urceolata]
MSSIQLQAQSASIGQELDPFDDLLGLEDGYYEEGYQVGRRDGHRAGLAEGRAFGMEKAFEKFTSIGRMHGRAVVWAGRLPGARETRKSASSQAQAEFMPTDRDSRSKEDIGVEAIRLRELSQGPRLIKHVRILWALSEPESLAVANEEESVSEFDDRYKRATVKARIIGKMVGEEMRVVGAGEAGGDHGPAAPNVRSTAGDVGIEDVDILKVRH